MNTERIWFWLDRLKLFHLFFWIFHYFFWVIVYRPMYKDSTDLYMVMVVYEIFNMITFYSISYWVAPRFYHRDRYFLALVLFLLILIVTSTGLALSLVQVTLWLGKTPTYPLILFIGYTMASNIIVLVIGTTLRQLTARLRMAGTAAAVRRKQTEAELQYLKAQVNPHFLFNAINSVYFLIKKDPDLASETLIKLSDLLRFQLYDCSEDTITIEQEREYLENYMALEKLRKGDRVMLEYSPEGDLHGFRMAPLVLIAFLENAFKFVSNYTDRENLIRVILRREEKLFRASFYNTYEPLPSAMVGGIGIRNVRRRLELLYPDHTLDVRDERGTYLVTLTIPLA
ncbi:histidine kinase [Fulvivirgaceae bacterium PWU5]|uniref:Histidine kinase n=1 Tax=Dawidia cretensis TaxID=2782350 RepID=A0AAP2E037_9BACT|nr:sensor histidine kinase [Dawidia cretensis]MBT1710618.1 histidine kinase [Dawidia cretensis]